MFAGMAEHWIEAAQALEIIGDPISLCTRLHAGLLRARAKSFSNAGAIQHDVAIAKEFWWAEGHEALDQNWRSGDFSTWIASAHQYHAFGVMFPLGDVLAMLPFERRAIIARQLSVAGSPDWLSAKDARQVLYTQLHNPGLAGAAIVEQGRLGFVAARAVLAQGAGPSTSSGRWDWEEREWDIPTWFWTEFTSHGSSNQDWALGRFSGKGRAPDGTRAITLSGIHFYRASLSDPAPAAEAYDAAPPNRGRKPKYDWTAAINECWGEVYRDGLTFTCQADVEKRLIAILAVGDDEPGESTVRPYASQIWAEYEKP